MRRTILLSILVAIVITTNAQVPKRIINYETNKLIKVNRFENRVNIVEKNNPDLVRSQSALHMIPVKANMEHKVDPNTVKNVSIPNVKSVLNSVPEGLIGTFKCKGVSYFGGIIEGETVITADKTNANKIWFNNLVPGASNKAVYGIVGADQKTVSIPQGQQIFVEGTTKVSLSMYGSSDDIKGDFDLTTAVFTVTSDLWGAEASDGWFELFTGNVTYTRLDMVPPSASYRQPQGGIFMGLVPDTWDYYSTTCIVNSAYSTWNWQNTSIENDVSYSWNYADSITGEVYTASSDSLIMNVEDNFYSTPSLTATNQKGLSSSYILGANYRNKKNPSYTIAGGNGAWLGFDAACDYGVANQDNGFTLLSYNNSSFFFGTGASQFSDTNYESLLLFYDKPLSTLYFEGVNVYLFVFNAPKNTPFTMNVILAEKDAEGYSTKGQVVAYSTITSQDVIPIKYNNEIVGYTMKFGNFKINNSGFWENSDYVEIDKAFYLELKGFNVSGVSLAACTEEINPLDGESRSAFTIPGDNSIYVWKDKRQTMFFNLDGAAYSYISLNESVIYDNRSGGTYEIEASPYFDSISFYKEYLPDWVHVEVIKEEYSDTYWGAKMEITIDPLVKNSEPRYASIDFYTVGAKKTLFINQGGKVGVDLSKMGNDLFFSIKNDMGYLLNYPKDMKDLTIYSVSGKLIRKLTLSESGQYQLDNSLLSKGINILRLQNRDKILVSMVTN